MNKIEPKPMEMTVEEGIEEINEMKDISDLKLKYLSLLKEGRLIKGEKKIGYLLEKGIHD